jgi:hypothetical protein
LETGFGNAFDPGRNVDTIAENVAALDDGIADIDADAKPDRIGLGPPISRSRSCR